MSRQKFEKTFNTFTKGLMTEASELNFPEDFSLYEKNFLLHRDGGRDRRRGMELLYPLGLTLTSKPYEVEKDTDSLVVEGFATDLLYVETVRGTGLETESLVPAGTVKGIRLRSTLFEFENGFESLSASGNVRDIKFGSVLVDIGAGDPEEITSSGQVKGIKLDKVLVTYGHPDPEILIAAGTVKEIFLNAN